MHIMLRHATVKMVPLRICLMTGLGTQPVFEGDGTETEIKVSISLKQTVFELKELILVWLSQDLRRLGVGCMSLMFVHQQLTNKQVLEELGIRERSEIKLAIWPQQDDREVTPQPSAARQSGNLSMRDAARLLAAEAAREKQLEDAVFEAHE